MIKSCSTLFGHVQMAQYQSSYSILQNPLHHKINWSFCPHLLLATNPTVLLVNSWPQPAPTGSIYKDYLLLSRTTLGSFLNKSIHYKQQSLLSLPCSSASRSLANCHLVLLERAKPHLLSWDNLGQMFGAWYDEQFLLRNTKHFW